MIDYKKFLENQEIDMDIRLRQNLTDPSVFRCQLLKCLDDSFSSVGFVMFAIQRGTMESNIAVNIFVSNVFLTQILGERRKRVIRLLMSSSSNCALKIRQAKL